MKALSDILANGFAGNASAFSGGGGNSDPLDLTATGVAAPAADTVRLFRRSLANRHMPAFVGPSGQDSTLQPSLHANRVVFINPSSGTTAPNIIGGTLTTAATMSLPALATTSLWTSMLRKRFQSSATAGNGSGMRTGYGQFWRGNANGMGGFFYRARVGQNLNVNGGQVFHGLCGSTAVLGTGAGAVGALVNMIGMGYDTTDGSGGNWQLFRNDSSGTATKVNLGANAARGTDQGFDLILFCPPYSGGAAQSIWAEVWNLNTGVQVLAPTEYTTDLPGNTNFMALKNEANNGAVASAVNVEVASVYAESDY
jgi:hypothetical protein